jgi:hypothetical protein
VVGALLECAKTQSWREKLLNSKRLNIIGDTAYGELTGCTEITELRNLSNLLYKIKCKWYNQENRIQGNGKRKGMNNYCKAGRIV